MGSSSRSRPNASMPAGLSPAGQMIWRALRDYGAYVVDSQGVPAAAPELLEPASRAAADRDQPGPWHRHGDDRAAAPLGHEQHADQDERRRTRARLAPLAPDIATG